MKTTPKRSFIENLESQLEHAQRQKDLPSIARLYEILGHVYIETLSTATRLEYWFDDKELYSKDWPTASFFNGIRCLIKASRAYIATENTSLADNLYQRTLMFLNMATQESFFDEKVLNAIAYEVMGDIFYLKGDFIQAKECFNQSRDIYQAIYSADESSESTWQVQGEYEVLGARFEELDSEASSELILEPFEKRIELKAKS